MGVIQSIFCTITFCLERVLTWACCAFVLMLLMFGIIIMMVYGISVGYHYAQKELASFAMSSRTTTEAHSLLRSMKDPEPPNLAPVVRLVAVNRSQVTHAAAPMLEVYQSNKPNEGEHLFMETTETAIIMLETERMPRAPDLSPHEQELARRLIGRFRRSRQNTNATNPPFFRPLRNSTEYEPI